jgi:hypothetical protein
MQRIQVKTRPRPREITAADPPTINRKIARTWFHESSGPGTGGLEPTQTADDR